MVVTKNQQGKYLTVYSNYGWIEIGSSDSLSSSDRYVELVCCLEASGRVRQDEEITEEEHRGKLQVADLITYDSFDRELTLFFDQLPSGTKLPDSLTELKQALTK